MQINISDFIIIIIIIIHAEITVKLSQKCCRHTAIKQFHMSEIITTN